MGGSEPHAGGDAREAVAVVTGSVRVTRGHGAPMGLA
jgi:hypothetical protein